MNEVALPIVLIVARDDSPGAKNVATSWHDAVPTDTHEVIWATSVQTGLTAFSLNRKNIVLLIVTDQLPGGYTSEQLLRQIDNGFGGILVTVSPDRNNIVARGRHHDVGERHVMNYITHL